MTVHQQPPPAALPEPSLRLQQQFLQSISGVGKLNDALTRISTAILHASGATATFFAGRDEEGTLQAATRADDGEAIDILDDDLRLALEGVIAAVVSQGRTCTARFESTQDHVLVASPVFQRGCPPEVFATICPTAEAATCAGISQLAASHITMWRVLQSYEQQVAVSKRASQQHAVRCATEAPADAMDLRAATAILELTQKVRQCDELDQACITLAGEAASLLECEQAVVGLCKSDGACYLEAVSGMPGFDRGSEFARTAEAVLEEALLRDEVTAWPSATGDSHATLAHQSLRALTDAACIVSAPLHNAHGEQVGAWAFLLNTSLPEQPLAELFLRGAATPVGVCISDAKQIAGGYVARMTRAVQSHYKGWKFKACVAAAGVLLAAMLIPWPYKISCESTVEPVVSRYVAAPFAGPLEKAFVTPGDTVSKGDLLARMDGREIRWELEKIIAEHHRAAKKRDSAMAQSNVAEKQLARLEMDRLEVQMKLLRQRIADLEIRSPVSGVVTTGELDKAEGAPLETGQTLFEIAPLDRMVIEIDVPGEDIAYTRQGQQVALRLDAYPGRVWTAEVSRIHPRSEMRDQKNVFVAEMDIENPDGQLRPGMAGRAKVTGPWMPLGWNLFHKPWHSLLRTLGF